MCYRDPSISIPWTPPQSTLHVYAPHLYLPFRPSFGTLPRRLDRELEITLIPERNLCSFFIHKLHAQPRQRRPKLRRHALDKPIERRRRRNRHPAHVTLVVQLRKSRFVSFILKRDGRPPGRTLTRMFAISNSSHSPVTNPSSSSSSSGALRVVGRRVTFRRGVPPPASLKPPLAMCAPMLEIGSMFIPMPALPALEGARLIQELELVLLDVLMGLEADCIHAESCCCSCGCGCG